MKSWYYTSYAVYFSFSLKIFAIAFITTTPIEWGQGYKTFFVLKNLKSWENFLWAIFPLCNRVRWIIWILIHCSDSISKFLLMKWFVNMKNINVLFAFNFTFFCKYPKLHPVFKNCYKILFSSNPKVFSFRKFLQNNFYKIQVIKIVFASICVRNWKQTFSRKIFTLFIISAVHIK